ncbi:MAG: hypothetical protein J6D37_07665 [Clostridia bacterium]|nr:hypothetical protein [Clostridia bacterium]
MQLFSLIQSWLTQVKEWQLSVAFCALPVLWFLVCCPLKSKTVFSVFSEVSLCLCFVVFSATYSLRDGLLFSVLYLAEARLFYKLIPTEQKKGDKEDKPPKIVCYEPQIEPPRVEIASHSLEETNLCLDHAFEVANKLKSYALEGSDRLEIDNVELTLRLYRQKGMLTDREMRSLNDCLALLLKYTAKYDCAV